MVVKILFIAELAVMIAKTVYLFLAVVSMLSSTGLLQNLSITGVIWTGADLILTLIRFLQSARHCATNPFKLVLHRWLVELLGEYSKVIYLISANLDGPTWGFESPHYEFFKWLFVCSCFGDPFSGMPQRLELSTSIIVDEQPVQGCLRELKPLKLKVRSCIIILDEEQPPGWCFIIKSTNVSKKWRFDRQTAEILYQVFVLMDEETFIVVSGDPAGNWLRCIGLDDFIRRSIVETRSGLIAHRRVVCNEEMKAYI